MRAWIVALALVGCSSSNGEKEALKLANDLATDANGTLYVTDTAVKADATGAFVPTGTDAVWRFTPAGETGKVIEGSVLGGPNGIAFRGQDGFVVTFGSGEIYAVDAKGKKAAPLNTFLCEILVKEPAEKKEKK